jgi:hypothetical protein
MHPAVGQRLIISSAGTNIHAIELPISVARFGRSANWTTGMENSVLPVAGIGNR